MILYWYQCIHHEFATTDSHSADHSEILKVALWLGMRAALNSGYSHRVWYSIMSYRPKDLWGHWEHIPPQ